LINIALSELSDSHAHPYVFLPVTGIARDIINIVNIDSMTVISKVMPQFIQKYGLEAGDIILEKDGKTSQQIRKHLYTWYKSSNKWITEYNINFYFLYINSYSSTGQANPVNIKVVKKSRDIHSVNLYYEQYLNSTENKPLFKVYNDSILYINISDSITSESFGKILGENRDKKHIDDIESIRTGKDKILETALKYIKEH
jgi:triacylglycerol esterase/lipase EstA (alpha/beta hydrolase family)